MPRRPQSRSSSPEILPERANLRGPNQCDPTAAILCGGQEEHVVLGARDERDDLDPPIRLHARGIYARGDRAASVSRSGPPRARPGFGPILVSWGE